MSELKRIYTQYRRAGANAHLAYTAAFCAVRVSAYKDAEITTWMHVLNTRDDAQLRSIRDAISTVPPKR